MEVEAVGPQQSRVPLQTGRTPPLGLSAVRARATVTDKYLIPGISLKCLWSWPNQEENPEIFPADSCESRTVIRDQENNEMERFQLGLCDDPNKLLDSSAQVFMLNIIGRESKR